MNFVAGHLLNVAKDIEQFRQEFICLWYRQFVEYLRNVVCQKPIGVRARYQDSPTFEIFDLFCDRTGHIDQVRPKCTVCRFSLRYIDILTFGHIGLDQFRYRSQIAMFFCTLATSLIIKCNVL